MRISRLFALLACLQLCWGASSQLSVTDVARFDFKLRGIPANGLSGIAHYGEDEYLVVGDAGTLLHRLSIKLDRSIGEVQSVIPQPALQLRDANGLALLEGELKDREDLAIGFGHSSIFIVNENCGSTQSGPCIDQHSLDTGRLMTRTSTDVGGQLGVFIHAELNRSFEAIAARPDGRGFWLANERALPVDGAPATTSAGCPVRLQLLDSRLQGVAQYVYVTDPIAAIIESPEALVRHSGSRLVGLTTLPDDSLIALENVLQGNSNGLPQTRIRLYHVVLGAATDVSTVEFASSLKKKDLTPVEKHLLIELAFEDTYSNYEGIALGPRLDNGDHAILLIRDNGRGDEQSVHSLRLRVGR